MAPLLGLGVLVLIIGYQLGGLIAPPARVYLQIIFLALLFALIILDSEPGWNLVLYICFSVAAGMILLWSGAEVKTLKSWALFLILLITSLAGGAAIKGAYGQAARILTLSTLLYMLGWILFAFTSLPPLLSLIWTILGLLLFTVISMAVISQAKTLPQDESSFSLGVQIFVVQFNLFWLSALIWTMI